MKKILITGYTGMLGWELYKQLKTDYDIYLISSSMIKKKKKFKI